MTWRAIMTVCVIGMHVKLCEKTTIFGSFLSLLHASSAFFVFCLDMSKAEMDLENYLVVELLLSLWVLWGNWNIQRNWEQHYNVCWSQKKMSWIKEEETSLPKDQVRKGPISYPIKVFFCACVGCCTSWQGIVLSAFGNICGKKVLSQLT